MSKRVDDVLVETLPITKIDRPEEDEAKRARLATDWLLRNLTEPVEANGQRLDAGDGAAISDEAAIVVKGQADRSELLVFDLPA